MIKRYLRRFPPALSAITHAVRHDFSFRTQLITVTPALSLFGYFFWPLTETEILFLILGYVLILITELQNSALETALDKIHPELHREIGKSKDLAAAATLLAGLFLLTAMVVIALY